MRPPSVAGETADALPSAPRPRRYSTELVVAVAVEVFNRRGYDATSLEDLAAATQLSKSSIYHHTRGKEHLLRLALQRALEALFATLEEPESRSGEPVDQLRHVLGRATEVLLEETPYVALLLRVRGNTETERWGLERRREFDRRVTELAASAIERGQVRPDLSARMVTRLLFGMVNSISDWFRSTSPADGEEVVASVLAVFDGLLSPTASTRPRMR
jgi:AcrR family transcriptional regulator